MIMFIIQFFTNDLEVGSPALRQQMSGANETEAEPIGKLADERARYSEQESQLRPDSPEMERFINGLAAVRFGVLPK